MLPIDLIRRIADICERMRLDYYVTGSVASSMYGRLRTTQDVDVVIALPPGKVPEFCAAFPAPEFYVDPQLALDCVRNEGQFNIIHVPTALKADVMLFRDTAFDSSRLSRRRMIRVDEHLSAWFAAPEDVILKKLEYFREGRSDKHLSDIAAMLQVSGDRLDRAYLEHWALRLGVQGEWRAVAEKAGLTP